MWNLSDACHTSASRTRLCSNVTRQHGNAGQRKNVEKSWLDWSGLTSFQKQQNQGLNRKEMVAELDAAGPVGSEPWGAHAFLGHMQEPWGPSFRLDTLSRFVLEWHVLWRAALCVCWTYVFNGGAECLFWELHCIAWSCCFISGALVFL